MNTKNKIVAILMASIVAMAVAVPMAIGTVSEASVNDVPSTYDCSGTNISLQPDPVNSTDGTVNLELKVNDNNGADTIPDTGWTAEVNFGTGLQTTPLAKTSINDTAEKFTNTTNVPANTASGNYDVTFKNSTGVTVCTKTVTVGEVLSISVADMNFGFVDPGAQDRPGNHTVTNTGNVKVKFVDALPAEYDNNASDGITWINMTGSGTADGETIADSTLTTDWDENTEIAIGASPDVNFTLDVPLALKAGPYAGSTTFTPTKA